MHFKELLLALAASATVLDSALAANSRGTANNGNTGNANALALNPQLVQKASESTGGAAAGQAASATDNANFINFCQGKTITNGAQLTGGSCNGIVMGDIPAKTNMVSTVLTFPQNGQDIAANQAFNVTLQVANLQAGSFTNATSTYYAAPQAVNNQGNIVGHVHVTIQDLGGTLNPSTPPDPSTFAFFKGIDDAGDGNGGLSATVASGLPAGFYRLCSMSSSSNHQPVLMPVAQRGAQDDCTKFTVGQGNGNSNNGATGQGNAATGNAKTTGGGGSGGKNRGGQKSIQTSSNTGTDAATSSTASVPASTDTAATSSSSQAATSGNSKSQALGRGRGRGRFVTRNFIA